MKTKLLSDGIKNLRNPDFFLSTSSSLALASVLLSPHSPNMAAAAPAILSMVKAGIKRRDGTSSVSSFY